MIYKKLPTQKRLLELFLYNRKTGNLHKKKNNKISGSKDNRGYLRSSVDGGRYKNSRLIWMYVYGECLNHMVIDHINGDVADNRIDNIRLVNEKENLRNKKLYKNNKTGTPGVFWKSSRNRWCARIKIDSKEIQVGSFKSKQEAVKARNEADIKYGFHTNHGV